MFNKELADMSKTSDRADWRMEARCLFNKELDDMSKTSDRADWRVGGV